MTAARATVLVVVVVVAAALAAGAVRVESDRVDTRTQRLLDQVEKQQRYAEEADRRVAAVRGGGPDPIEENLAAVDAADAALPPRPPDADLDAAVRAAVGRSGAEMVEFERRAPREARVEGLGYSEIRLRVDGVGVGELQALRDEVDRAVDRAVTVSQVRAPHLGGGRAEVVLRVWHRE